jgi:deazaflavin-dependent oxidoreductase (nitroreductase family)
MPLPSGLARFNRVVTNRVLGVLAPYAPGFGRVIHSGRKSGCLYRTPVNVFPHGERYVFALTYGAKTDWVRNVLAADGCLLETRGRVVRLKQPRVVRDERRRAVPRPVRRILGLVDVADFLELSVDQSGAAGTG